MGKPPYIQVKTAILFSLFSASALAPLPVDAASKCFYDSYVKIINNTGVKLSAVAFIHKFGEAADRGPVDFKIWENLEDGASSPPDDLGVVRSHSGWTNDYWTVVFSYKQKNTKDDVVFQAFPHNARKQVEDVKSLLVTALQTMTSLELKRLSEGTPEVTSAEPLVKVLVASLVNTKNPSLHRYTKINLKCPEDVEKTTIITIGNKQDTLRKNIFKIKTATKDEEVDYASTPITVAELRKTIEEKLKEKPLVQTTKPETPKTE